MTAAKPVKEKSSLVWRLVRWGIWTILALVVAFAIFFFWASSGDSDDRETAPGTISENSAAAPAPAQVPELRVMTFNIGYGRGPAGDASGPWSEEQIHAGLDGIVGQIKANATDLVFLQEVDLASARSHDIDQGKYLLEGAGLRFSSCVTTWEKNYVPFPYWPPSKHYGRMRSGQCVLSRFPIVASTRHRLPQPDANPWWRNRFYLNRAIDQVKVMIAGNAWEVFNVHIEAFDIPNRVDHAQRLAALVSALPEKARVIVAGDFNAPPPEATQKKGFVDEPEADFSTDTTIAVVRGMGLPEALPDPAAFTFPADGPTRRLDYIYFGSALTKVEAKVLGQSIATSSPLAAVAAVPPPGPFSDHLPLFARFTVR